MPAPSRLTIELDPAVSARLEALADRDGRDPAELGVAGFVALEAAHAAEIEAALQVADAGDFATDAEVAAVFARWNASRPR